MGKPKVVVAEDDGEVRRTLVELLQPSYDVVAAVADGRQFVEAVRRLRPDAVVLNNAMPELSGLDALRQLKTEGIEVKAIVISANTASAYVRRAFELGAQGYVSKAAGTEDLPRALDVVLEGRKFVSASIKATPEGEVMKGHDA